MASRSGALVFAIVGKNELVFEADLSKPLRFSQHDPQAQASSENGDAHVHQFVLHSSLDLVEQRMKDTTSMYLKVVDEFNDFQVYAFVTASSAKFLLLHEFNQSKSEYPPLTSRNEESIKQFFAEVYEFYIKIILNPFYQCEDVIESTLFRQKVFAIARKHL